jgi:hypothetical protein
VEAYKGMAKLLVSGRWYEEVGPTSLYEADLERIIVDQAPVLYPQFHAVSFKCTVYSEEDAAQADLALIERAYKEWWVVEVEKPNHSLDGHVLPQVRTLSRAVYGPTEAAVICSQCKCLEHTRVADMMKGKQPRVLVIVNARVPHWIEPLKKYDAMVATIEIFRSDRNEHIFRINGEAPCPRQEVISTCYLDRAIPRFVLVEAPSALGVEPKGKVMIRVDDCATQWIRVDAQDRVWLTSVGPNPLSPGVKYDIVKGDDGALSFRPRNSRG